jgi:hypothetical protein
MICGGRLDNLGCIEPSIAELAVLFDDLIKARSASPQVSLHLSASSCCLDGLQGRAGGGGEPEGTGGSEGLLGA